MTRGAVCARGAAAVRAAAGARARATTRHWWRPLGPSASLARGTADSDLFELRARTADSLANLRRRGAADVRVADAVEAGGRPASPLFLTQNHPATALLVACADRVLRVLGFSALPRGAYKTRGRTRRGSRAASSRPVFLIGHRIVGAARRRRPCRPYLAPFDRVVRGMCAGDYRIYCTSSCLLQLSRVGRDERRTPSWRQEKPTNRSEPVP